ncbi:MAG: hypothetical protein QOG77_3262 [Solirubrobacteraceae bacterium]|jgi:Tol biopolymer transport system component|nr:hypothetical protein [Solirubrobacteraceae bacterium]
MARRHRLAATLAVAGSLAGAGEAGADSIVFVKRGDVWLAKSDGTGQRALTRDGTPQQPYRSPTQSTRGVITALKGRRDVYVIDRRGRRRPRARDITGGPTPPFDPILVDAEISPDGKTLASTMWLTTRDQDANPGEPTGTDLGTLVWYSRVSDGRPLGQTRDGQSPSWTGDGTLLVFAPNVPFVADAWTASLAAPEPPAPWFQDRAVVDPADVVDGAPLDHGELTRARDRLALIRGPNTAASTAVTSIRVYAATGLGPRPTERCDVRQAPSTAYGDPTWSPDGRRLAWGERDGVWTTPIAPGAGDCGLQPRLLIRGGAEPDWGPAGVSARGR